LVHGESSGQRQLFHRANGRPHASARRPIGLRQDKRDFMTGIREACQRYGREPWRAGED
jgi:hypothetical protein